MNCLLLSIDEQAVVTSQLFLWEKDLGYCFYGDDGTNWNPVIRRCCGEYDVSKTLLKKHPNADFRNVGSPYRNHREMPLSCENLHWTGGGKRILYTQSKVEIGKLSRE